MLKKLLLSAIACLIIQSAIAQNIKPYDLIQLYKYSQVNESQYGKSIYQYLSTVDTGWKLTAKPIVDESSSTVDYAYTKTGKSWFEPESHHLMVTRTYGPPVLNSVIYIFKDIELWKAYSTQMVTMNATKLGITVQDGGTRTLYSLNGIGFILVDFPPGIQGPDRTFEVMIVTQNNH